MRMQINILHIITDLDTGGAEMMLYKLLAESAGKPVNQLVISLMGEGPVQAKIEALGIEVKNLELRQGQTPKLRSFKLLRQMIKQFQPNVIQGWMYHGNLAASMGVMFLGVKAKVVWNIRQTLYDFVNEKSKTRLIIRLSAWLSKRPDCILYNSSLSRQQHEGIGFSSV